MDFETLSDEKEKFLSKYAGLFDESEDDTEELSVMQQGPHIIHKVKDFWFDWDCQAVLLPFLQRHRKVIKKDGDPDADKLTVEQMQRSAMYRTKITRYHHDFQEYSHITKVREQLYHTLGKKFKNQMCLEDFDKETRTIADQIECLASTVVKVSIGGGLNGEGGGSGFLAKLPNGTIVLLTNCHVLPDEETAKKAHISVSGHDTTFPVGDMLIKSKPSLKLDSGLELDVSAFSLSDSCLKAIRQAEIEPIDIRGERDKVAALCAMSEMASMIPESHLIPPGTDEILDKLFDCSTRAEQQISPESGTLDSMDIQKFLYVPKEGCESIDIIDLAESAAVYTYAGSLQKQLKNEYCLPWMCQWQLTKLVRGCDMELPEIKCKFAFMTFLKAVTRLSEQELVQLDKIENKFHALYEFNGLVDLVQLKNEDPTMFQDIWYKCERCFDHHILEQSEKLSEFVVSEFMKRVSKDAAGHQDTQQRLSGPNSIVPNTSKSLNMEQLHIKDEIMSNIQSTSSCNKENDDMPSDWADNCMGSNTIRNFCPWRNDERSLMQQLLYHLIEYLENQHKKCETPEKCNAKKFIWWLQMLFPLVSEVPSGCWNIFQYFSDITIWENTGELKEVGIFDNEVQRLLMKMVIFTTTKWYEHETQGITPVDQCQTWIREYAYEVYNYVIDFPSKICSSKLAHIDLPCCQELLTALETIDIKPISLIWDIVFSSIVHYLIWQQWDCYCRIDLHYGETTVMPNEEQEVSRTLQVILPATLSFWESAKSMIEQCFYCDGTEKDTTSCAKELFNNRLKSMLEELIVMVGYPHLQQKRLSLGVCTSILAKSIMYDCHSCEGNSGSPVFAIRMTHDQHLKAYLAGIHNKKDVALGIFALHDQTPMSIVKPKPITITPDWVEKYFSEALASADLLKMATGIAYLANANLNENAAVFAIADNLTKLLSTAEQGLKMENDPELSDLLLFGFAKIIYKVVLLGLSQVLLLTDGVRLLRILEMLIDSKANTVALNAAHSMAYLLSSAYIQHKQSMSTDESLLLEQLQHSKAHFENALRKWDLNRPEGTVQLGIREDPGTLINMAISTTVKDDGTLCSTDFYIQHVYMWWLAWSVINLPKHFMPFLMVHSGKKALEDQLIKEIWDEPMIKLAKIIIKEIEKYVSE